MVCYTFWLHKSFFWCGLVGEKYQWWKASEDESAKNASATSPKNRKCTPETPAVPLSPALDGHREARGRFQTADEEVWGDEEALHWHIGNPWVIISISSVVLPWEMDGPESPAIWRLAFSAYLCQVDFGKGEYISAHPFTKVTVFPPLTVRDMMLDWEWLMMTVLYDVHGLFIALKMLWAQKIV